MSKDTKLLEKAYRKKIKAGTEKLTKVLDSYLRLVPQEKQLEIMKVVEGKPELNFENGFAYMDIASAIYTMYDTPIIRYRFRLKGQQFDFVVEENKDGGEKEGHNANAANSGSRLVGIDGRPIRSGK